ncbi:MAG TPA: CU044_5270 family protein, partial [Solirubrobacteraceae bacterium]|nr:CU044_5270 family protein [Solirubrobacteraceae bacterium]
MSDYFDHLERHLLDAVERRAAHRTPVTDSPPPPSRTRPLAIGPSRAWVVLAAVIVLVAVALVFALGGPGGRVPEVGPPNASAELSRLAAVAGEQPREALGDGQYSYRLVEHQGQLVWPGCEVTTRIRDELWEAADGSGFSRTTVSPPMAATTAVGCRARAAREGREQGLGVVESGYAARCLGFRPRELDTLPQDAAAIRSALLAAAGSRSGQARPLVLLGLIGERLSWRGLSPAQRSDLFEIAATLPGVRLLGPLTDPFGRSGVGLAANDRGVGLEVVFDPSSSALLAQRVTQPSGGGARETSWEIYRPIQIV